jgi:geranylgeranyl diphosphate synthase, type II
VTGTDQALGKPQGSDERHGKRTYVSEFGIQRARELAGESHRTARDALRQAAAAVAQVRPAGSLWQATTTELEQITDFIYTRTS